MDYEREYKKALGWMREIYPSLKGADKENAEHYFPELTESEDERIRKSIIKLLQQGGYMSPEDKTKAFAYLEKQKEQKPAEWSEEDEKIRQDIENLIIFALKEDSAVSPAAETTKEQAIDWLKSLRPQPHWKPSEEQMGALNYAYCELFKRGDVGHNILGPFQSLIDTLRKL